MALSRVDPVEHSFSGRRVHLSARMLAMHGTNLTLTGLLILLAIAGVCGAIGRAIAGGTGGGCLVSIAVGFIGTLVGSLIANYFHFPELWVVNVEHHPVPIVWSIIGGALFVAVVHLLSGRRSEP
jgi:uncharacterized membrane protein YeaQ/YmgE (transglycosylase-associated protein family)